MELWKLSDGRAEAAGGAAGGEGRPGSSGSARVAAVARAAEREGGAAAPGEAPRPLVTVTGGVRAAGGGAPAVAKVAASPPPAPGSGGVRKTAARPAGEEAASSATSAVATMPAAPTRIEIGPSAAPPPAPARITGGLLPPRGAASTVRPAGGEAGAESGHVRRIGGGAGAAPSNGGGGGARPLPSGTAIAATIEIDGIGGDDDGPILVVESLPSPETLFDRTPVPLQERTFLVRYDSAAVAGVVGGLLLSVAFMLGRTSATQVEAQSLAAAAPAAASASASATASPGAARPETSLATASAPAAPARRIALTTEFELEPEPETAEPAPAPAPAAERPSPAPAERPAAPERAPSGSTGAAPAPATPEPQFGIMSVAGIPRKNAEAVSAFMGRHGLPARIVGSGDRCGVIVGGYAERKGAAIEADLAKVRALVYVDGKRPFANAYAYPLKQQR
jgi:hypothetical protein